jgi:cation transporter-like permease
MEVLIMFTAIEELDIRCKRATYRQCRGRVEKVAGGSALVSVLFIVIGVFTGLILNTTKRGE